MIEATEGPITHAIAHHSFLNPSTRPHANPRRPHRHARALAPPPTPSIVAPSPRAVIINDVNNRRVAEGKKKIPFSVFVHGTV